MSKHILDRMADAGLSTRDFCKITAISPNTIRGWRGRPPHESYEKFLNLIIQSRQLAKLILADHRPLSAAGAGDPPCSCTTCTAARVILYGENHE